MRVFKAPLWISLAVIVVCAAAFLALEYYYTERSMRWEQSTGLGAVAQDVFGQPAPPAMIVHRAEEYAGLPESAFVETATARVSTVSIDVDTASYTNVRRMLNAGQEPPPSAVRVEEMLNYFTYSYPDPEGSRPFSMTTEVAACPWKPEHALLRIGLKSKPIPPADLPPARLTFLLDVSGSMGDPEKLPLVKRAFALLVEQLRPQDSIAIAVYAGAAGLVLPPTAGSQSTVILDAIERLNAGGSTAGGEGLLLAYKTAREMYRSDASNRVILATDGDFNVGVSSDEEMVKLIESERDHGIFLTVLGFGMGDLKDSKLEKIADHGNGHYAYVDSVLEARKVFVEQLGANLQTVAKDVKFQVEFHPARVRSYRLIGYENRRLTEEDFRDDRKDAGDMGAGHAVTALYELVPNGPLPLPGDAFTLRVRYKLPQSAQSVELTAAGDGRTAEPSADFRFAAAVAEFGMVLTGSGHRGSATLESAIALAEPAVGGDQRRAEFVALARKAAEIRKGGAAERRADKP